jgi:ligand-binding SRPBCC domain-containing protein
MSVHQLKIVQRIPVSLDIAWDFFSHPKNLDKLTPEHLQLKYTNELFGDEMYPGQVITYKVKPVFGIPLFWMTEITHVRAKHFFVDEQRVGPYSLWHHQHHFKAIEGGVEMTDLIHYRVPGWLLGDIADKLYVSRQLKKIFTFRQRMVEELFGRWIQIKEPFSLKSV